MTVLPKHFSLNVYLCFEFWFFDFDFFFVCFCHIRNLEYAVLLSPFVTITNLVIAMPKRTSFAWIWSLKIVLIFCNVLYSPVFFSGRPFFFTKVGSLTLVGRLVDLVDLPRLGIIALLGLGDTWLTCCKVRQRIKRLFQLSNIKYQFEWALFTPPSPLLETMRG